MTTLETVRALSGLGSDVVPDEDLAVHLQLAQDWCDTRATGYGVSAPDSAVALMTIFFLRQYLDLKGVKPSSLSLPDISMATDVHSMCELAKSSAVEQIKALAFARGGAVKHIRSGKVGRWR